MPKIQTIKLRGGKGIEVTIDHNAKKKCKCGAEIMFGITKNNKMIPIELVSLAEWDVHWGRCKCEKDFRK